MFARVPLCHQGTSTAALVKFAVSFKLYQMQSNVARAGNKRQVLRMPSETLPTRAFRWRGFCRTRVDCSRSWTPSAGNLKWTDCD